MNAKNRILVVDDDASVRTMLTKLLCLHDYKVDAVNDGAQAIEKLGSNSYGLMILDRFMPVMDGFTAAAIIRSSDKFDNMKILMLTGDSVTKDVDETFEAGVDGYIVKPVSIKKLLEKIDAVMLKQARDIGLRRP